VKATKAMVQEITIKQVTCSVVRDELSKSFNKSMNVRVQLLNGLDEMQRNNTGVGQCHCHKTS